MTLDKFCKRNNLSRRTVSRKIKSGELRPEIIKSKQGTREYRFTDLDEASFQHTRDKKNICYLCGHKTSYSDEELNESMKISLCTILDVWLEQRNVLYPKSDRTLSLEERKIVKEREERMEIEKVRTAYFGGA